MNTKSRDKFKNDNIIRTALVLWLCALLGGCAFAFTNQPPSPGGCTGEPHKVYC